MKREKPHQGEEKECGPGGDMDELLEVLGYKVRSSDMADVADKLEQLEMALGEAAAATTDASAAISFDAVHYNPSDLSSWLHTMLYDLTPAPPPAGDDLRAIPGIAAFPPPPKRMRPSEPSPSRPVVLVDTQEAGVCLVQTLLACADAVQRDDLTLSDALVKRVGSLAAAQPGGAMRKVATYFAEALARRIYKFYSPDSSLGPSYTDALETHFYESCPYLKFAHFTANQAILEAFASAPRVHVIDFGLKQGMQWPALLQALALRPGGPPVFRLTGIGPPQPDGFDSLQQVGWKLAVLAETVGIDFKFRRFVVSSLADVEQEMLGIGDGEEEEVVAVNSVFELHRLLGRPGGIEKVLSSVKGMRPKIVTVVEQEANHNGPVFQDRFTEALHYYSSLFDSLEGSSGSVAPPPSQDLVMSELYLGRQICNVVACEGADRVERHEPLTRWRGQMESSGFQQVLLGSNAYRQASMLLAHFAGGDGYSVEESNGCLMLGWHTRPLIATSAWRVRVEEAGIRGMSMSLPGWGNSLPIRVVET